MACEVDCIVNPMLLSCWKSRAGIAGSSLTPGRHLGLQSKQACDLRVPGTQPVDAVPQHHDLTHCSNVLQQLSGRLHRWVKRERTHCSTTLLGL